MYAELTTEKKIIKVKIALQETHPFWAYLVLRMRITEDKNKKDGEIKDKEIILKSQTVELEKEQLLFSSGNAQEVNNF